MTHKAILHLGVIDQFYTTPPATPGAAPKTVSTAEVATFLETKYHIMDFFQKRHHNEIVRYIDESLRGAARNQLLGKPAILGSSPYDAGMAKIQRRFQSFLSLKEMDSTGIAGVPTKAALQGKSSRFKGGKNWIKVNGKKVYGVPRPSFIDTGLYQKSFKAWIQVEKVGKTSKPSKMGGLWSWLRGK